jgi:hypothetical protein
VHALSALPWPALVALALVSLAQVCLQLYSLYDLARRPAVVGGRKWLWLLVILFVNFAGAVLYLAVGRAPAPTPEPPAPRDTPRRAAEVADLLYGPRRS